MRLFRHSVAFLVFVAVVLPSQAGLKVYYLRHGESGSNVAKYWEKTPPEQRPSYVGNAGAFSPLGEKQVAAVPEKLGTYHFDFIAVSPLWRTRNTILPYLKAQKRTAEVWPELAEFNDRQGDLMLIGSAGLPPAAKDIFTAGKKIELTGDESQWFTLADGLLENHLTRKGAEGSADITAVVTKAIAHVKEKFAGTDKSILLVGHGNAGRQFFHLLLKEPAMMKYPIKNTGLWMAEEQADGTFKLLLVNDQPVDGHLPKDTSAAKPAEYEK